MNKPVRERPGLLEYLEQRLGRSGGSGAEREFFCFACIDREGSESNKRKLGINVHKGKAKCFRCGYSAGSLERLFRDMNGGQLLLVEASIIQGEIKLPLTDVKAAVRAILKPAAKDATKLLAHGLPNGVSPLYGEKGQSRAVASGQAYLRKRGVTAEQIEAFKLGYCRDGDLAHRIVFPISLHGRQVYWTTRYCGDHYMKSKNPLNKEGYFRKTDVLLNYDAVVGLPVIAVVEGPFDCMAYTRHDLDVRAVALMGKELSAAQLALIDGLVKNGLKEVIVSLDPDAGDYAEKIYGRLSDRVERCSILYLTHGDPDERREELAELLQARTAPSVTSQVRSRLFRKK